MTQPQDPPPPGLSQPPRTDRSRMVNLVVCVAGTVLLKALRVRDGGDQTVAADYFTDVPEQPQAEPVVTAGGLA